MPHAIILDANLLVLLVVGSTDRSYISKHRRLGSYDEEDFDLLHLLIASASSTIVTPNILTEASNLSRQIAEPARTRISTTFRVLIKKMEERYIDSARASDQPEFLRLGLTDASILEEMDDTHMLLTADLDLYLAALERGYKAENFNHLREL